MAKRKEREEPEIIELDVPFIIPNYSRDLSGNTRTVFTMGLNASIFYEHLYAALFGGKVSKRYKLETERMANGERRNEHPDIRKVERGYKGTTEIKATCQRARRPLCGERQLENLAQRFLFDLERTRGECHLDYGFFVYGRRRDNMSDNYWPSDSGLLKVVKLNRALAESTRALIILPSNFLFYTFIHSRRIVRNQVSNSSTLNEAVQRQIPCNIMSQLVLGSTKLKGVVYGRDQEAARDLLMIDGVEYEISESPANLTSFSIPIKPFRIIKYRNKDEKAWMDRFRQAHGEILVDLLGIRDLYQIRLDARRKKREEAESYGEEF